MACVAGARSARRVAVEALEHLQLGELRAVLGDRLVEVEVPRSTSWSAATVVTIFVIDAMRNIVSGVIGSSAPASRTPAAPS